jgi:hypothetical protein
LVRIAATEVRPGLFVPLVTIQLLDIPRPDGSTAGWRGLAIVDSGADFSIVPAEILEGAGLKWSKLPEPVQESRGAGGAMKYRRFAGKLVWEGYTVSTLYAVAAPKGVPLPILGRDDFFRLFNVRFRWYKTPPEIEIDPGVPDKKPSKRK